MSHPLKHLDSTLTPQVLYDTSMVRQIKVVKPSQECAILPSRKVQALQRIENMASELGRMQKLLDELRADLLHLTTE